MSKHSRARAVERYNIQLSKIDEQNILNKIRKQEAIFIKNSEENPNRKFVYVEYNNIPLKVLYLRTKNGVKQIITIYPFDADEYNSLMKKDFESKINSAMQFLRVNGYVVYKKPNRNTCN